MSRLLENPAAASSSVEPAVKKEKKDKSEKKTRKERKVEPEEPELRLGGDAGPSTTVDEKTESKEAKRARKEAKRLAKAQAAGEAVTDYKNETILPAISYTSAVDDKLEDPSKPTAVAEIDEEARKRLKKEKKEKKRKLTEIDSGATPSRIDAASTSDEPPRKSKKSNTASIDQPIIAEDIFTDSALSDQAKKAISYVQQYATTHIATSDPAAGKAWKFNKAKQGWLMRNIWNDEEIPEKYIEMVMAYLQTLQGNARAGLIVTAEKLANAPETEMPVGNPSNVDEGGGEATEVAGPKLDGDAAKAVEGAEAEAAETEVVKGEVRRERAKMMLRLLGLP